MPTEIRIYEPQQDGQLLEISSSPIEHYGGVCPNVGDTLCIDAAVNGPHFYAVQCRYFIDIDHVIGWAIIVREMEPAAQQKQVSDTWRSDTEFWDRSDQADREEQYARLLKMTESSQTKTSKNIRGAKKRVVANNEDRAPEKAKPSPLDIPYNDTPPEPIQPPLDHREARAMEYLTAIGPEKPIDWYRLKNFGPHTQKKLQNRGYIKVSKTIDRAGNPDEIWLTKSGLKAMQALSAHRSKYLVL